MMGGNHPGGGGDGQNNDEHGGKPQANEGLIKKADTKVKE